MEKEVNNSISDDTEGEGYDYDQQILKPTFPPPPTGWIGTDRAPIWGAEEGVKFRSVFCFDNRL